MIKFTAPLIKRLTETTTAADKAKALRTSMDQRLKPRLARKSA